MQYLYECQQCLHRFEVKQAMLAERKANCPQCGSDAKFIPCWTGSILFNFPSLDATDIMRREGKWNY